MEEAKKILDSCKEGLEPPEDFSFPFPPYGIQKDFMTTLYRAIEGKKLGIFESPTGTGKSLSIICGALTWLNDHEEREKNELKRAISYVDQKTKNNSKDWLSEQIKDMENQSIKAVLKKNLCLIEKKCDTIEKIINKFQENGKVPRKFISCKKKNDEIGLPFVESENPLSPNPECEDNDDDLILQDFSEDNEGGDTSDGEEEVAEKYVDTKVLSGEFCWWWLLGNTFRERKWILVKIIFCSRTHSQLSQFITELRKTSYSEKARIAPLASRQSYCINKTISKLKNLSLINERCLDLQKGSKPKAAHKGEGGEITKKKKVGSGCPNMRGVGELGEVLVSKVLDVEELKAEGEARGSCPYYGSRAAISNAQIVIVPYNTLLHRSTRQACGIEIENSVIIIDEAHNILETISHIHSTKISGQQLTHAYSQIAQYKDRYEKRFNALNLMYIKQLIYVIGCLMKIAGGKQRIGSEEGTNKFVECKLHTINDFITTAQIDSFNLYKLINFCHQSKILHKIQGFTEKYVPTVKSKEQPDSCSGIKAFLQEISKPTSTIQLQEAVKSRENETDKLTGQPLTLILALLENLTLNNNDGRVLVNVANIIDRSSIKFLLLDPAVTVRDIMMKARSVILAGGTMEPKGELRERLFLASGADPERIVEFSCGHVVPPTHILPIILTKGPTGKLFDFSYESRGTLLSMNELGRVLVNICNTVPGGIVCFFPSYEYESKVFLHLEKHGVLESIAKKKKVFREPKKSSEVDAVLNDFANTVHTASGKNGALLFSVVDVEAANEKINKFKKQRDALIKSAQESEVQHHGGKLSEGLNFSDELGRCVIVVGMPYPNIKSPELLEKMKYLETTVGSGAGQEHYEACCMKAVNQSIGRAVRHSRDYAVVLLLDKRYAAKKVVKLLPSWIGGSLITEEKFGLALSTIVKFFKKHEKTT